MAVTYHDLPVFVLANFYMYPNTIFPLMVFEERYLSLLSHALKKDKMLAIAHPIDQKQLDDYMCLVRIVQVERMPNSERFIVMVEGVSRLKMLSEVSTGDFLFRMVDAQEIENILPSQADALSVNNYVDQFKSFLIGFNANHPEVTNFFDTIFEQFHQKGDDVNFLVDFLSAHFTKNLHVKRQLLIEGQLIERMKLLLGEVEYFLMTKMQKGVEGN
jgi:ATP-dependent Lon protease